MSTKWTFVHVASCSGSHMSYVSPSLIPHDIILADIRAVLYLDDLERDAAGVFELVLRCLRDEYGLALVEHGPLLAARDLGGAAAVPLRFLRLLQQKVFKDAINFRTGHEFNMMRPFSILLAILLQAFCALYRLLITPFQCLNESLLLPLLVAWDIPFQFVHDLSRLRIVACCISEMAD